MLMIAIVYCYINGFIYICNINIAHTQLNVLQRLFSHG
nr:MAG TPA: hypothetical protein [Caudoviricetes sp.]